MSRRRRFGTVTTVLVALAGLITACAYEPTPIDADVIVIGGGIAGLSAALEASSHGANVLIIETSSVSGGHAVKAGGFALVGTPLQERKGFNDSPDIAYEDLMAWGEDPDPDWVRLFAENARSTTGWRDSASNLRSCSTRQKTPYRAFILPVVQPSMSSYRYCVRR